MEENTLKNIISASSSALEKINRNGPVLRMMLTTADGEEVLIKSDEFEEIIGAEYAQICERNLKNLKVHLLLTRGAAREELMKMPVESNL